MAQAIVRRPSQRHRICHILVEDVMDLKQLAATAALSRPPMAASLKRRLQRNHIQICQRYRGNVKQLQKRRPGEARRHFNVMLADHRSVEPSGLALRQQWESAGEI